MAHNSLGARLSGSFPRLFNFNELTLTPTAALTVDIDASTMAFDDGIACGGCASLSIQRGDIRQSIRKAYDSLHMSIQSLSRDLPRHTCRRSHKCA